MNLRKIMVFSNILILSEYFKILILCHKPNCNKCHLLFVLIHTSLNQVNNFLKSNCDPSNVYAVLVKQYFSGETTCRYNMYSKTE